jgi:hypothetical protein
VPSRDAGAFAATARATDSQFAATTKERQVELDLHKYKIGQSVRYNSNVARRFGSNASFKIVKLLPREDGHQQYRIKSASESHERVAKESDLNLDF